MAAPTSFKNLSGQRFTRLLVVAQADSDRNGNARWICQCDCGRTTISHGFSLRNGASKSCGCLTGEQAAKRNFRHGGYGSPAYRAWAYMLQRCTNPKTRRYSRYGGRGITVCERWREFPAFLEDMGPRPSPEHSLERKDNDGNYEPGNCVWATKSEQNSNKSNNHYVIYKGERMSLVQAIRAAGDVVTLGGVQGRLRRGWGVQESIETPANPNTWKNRPRRNRRHL